MKYISDVPPHPTVSQFTILFPSTHAEIIANFKEHLRALPNVEGKKVVAVIDSIISNPGVLLPWQEMVSDVPGPAQSHEPGQAEPVWAGPSQAIGDGPATALARLRGAESQSRRLRPQL